jgi:hypothetical protein
VVAVRREVDVINPDLGRLLDGKRVAGFREHLADLQVADDHVRYLDHADADAVQRRTALAQDGLVRAGLDDLVSGDAATASDGLVLWLLGLQTEGSLTR